MVSWIGECIFYELFLLGFCGVLEPGKEYQEKNRLKKVIQFIPHLKEMKVNAVYLGPVFESTYHGYDTIDYFKIDKRLGTNEDFKELCDKLHDNDIKIVIDGVFNHVGRDFFAFKDLQENRDKSRYCSWFVNLNFNGNTPENDGFYYEPWNRCFDLVKLNVWNEEVCEYLFKALDFWVDEFKIDGVRIDAADSIDFSFFKKLRNHINYKKEDLWLMGEVIHGDYSRWANDEMLHTTTNYECYKGLYSSHNDRNYFEIAHSFRRQFEKGGIYEKLCLYNFVDNHDVNRLASVIKNPEHIYNIYTLLYTMPGIPSIYYGSEYGIKAIKGKNTDLPLRPELNIDTLKVGNKKLFKLICDLGEIRSKSQAIRHGTYTPIIIRNEQFVFLRKFKEQEIYVALNLDDKNVDINYNFSFHKAIDLLSGKEISIDGNISIEPYGALIISKDNSI